MKKIYLTVALVATMVFASCSSTQKAKDEGADLKSKIESCTNPDSLKVYVDQAKAYATKLVSEGKDKEAEAYLNEIAPVVAAKDPSATSVFNKIESAADSVAGDANDAMKAAGDSVAAAANAVGDAVSDKVDAAKAAASQAADDAKAKAADAVDNAKAKAAQVADDAKTKAADAATQAADKVKDALGK